MSDLILSRVADHVCTITLNRPDKRNALSGEMVEALHATLTQMAGRGDVRVVVIAGAGSVFCAGLDLRELAAQREAGRVQTHSLQEALELLERCPQPTIAAVQGDAIAGGCELALHCDLRVASERAHFAMPLARIGIAVPVTLTWKLVETIGAAATKELLFTGETIGAPAALALGLVSRVAPALSLEGVVSELARQIAHNAPLSIRAMKAFVQRAVEERRGYRRDDLEELFGRVQASADAREGLLAQRERRTPQFRGE
jgi:enoyl-CoA hydratase/carnithine racemase